MRGPGWRGAAMTPRGASPRPSARRSRKCQRAYWPFHKEWCRQNDFADAAEKTEPKFARWMRKHGKMAVLKDGARSDPNPPPSSRDRVK